MRSPYRETTREIAEDTRPKHYNRLWFQFVVLLVVLAFGWFLGRSGKEKEIDYIDDNDIVIVDPIDPIDPIDDKKEKIDLKDSYLVRVYETEASETPVWFIELLDADSLWFDFIKANGMRLFTFDPDSDNQAESFVNAAKQKNIDPPFLIHAKGGKVLSVTAFEESLTVEKIKKLVESLK